MHLVVVVVVCDGGVKASFFAVALLPIGHFRAATEALQEEEQEARGSYRSIRYLAIIPPQQDTQVSPSMGRTRPWTRPVPHLPHDGT